MDFSGKRVFVTSDQHFFHSEIITFEKRPFSTVEEMNFKQKELWNSTVGKDDVIWCLGDISFGSQSQTRELVSSLNGHKILVMGDKERSYKVSTCLSFGYEEVYRYPVLYNNYIMFSHEPLLYNNGMFYNIFGHVHNTWTFETYNKGGACACVERHGYKPVLLSSFYKRIIISRRRGV